MQIFRVFAKREETYETLVEAQTKEEAMKIADENFDNFVWDEVDGSMNTKIDEAIEKRIVQSDYEPYIT